VPDPARIDPGEEEAMPAEETKALFARLVAEVFHGGRLDAVDELFTPAAVIHDPGVEHRGAGALRQGIRSLLAAFPDFRVTVEDQIADGDRLAVRYRGEGTHRGEWQGIPPTGKRISYPGMLIVRAADGRIAEYWAQPDLLGVFRQLGALPALATAPSAPAGER
jgi:predicted ester cyclase